MASLARERSAAFRDVSRRPRRNHHLQLDHATNLAAAATIVATSITPKRAKWSGEKLWMQTLARPRPTSSPNRPDRCVDSPLVAAAAAAENCTSFNGSAFAAQQSWLVESSARVLVGGGTGPLARVCRCAAPPVASWTEGQQCVPSSPVMTPCSSLVIISAAGRHESTHVPGRGLCQRNHAWCNEGHRRVPRYNLFP